MATSKAVDKTPEPATLDVIRKRYSEMAASIPDGGTDTGLVNILAAIDAVQEPGELDAPWESAGTEAIMNKAMEVRSLKRMPSDFGDGLGFFLVVEATIQDTGELAVFTTGSVAVVAQLVKAHANGWLPLLCELKESERPTKDGYRPQHLKTFGAAF
jgi:hypothetical protein